MTLRRRPLAALLAAPAGSALLLGLSLGLGACGGDDAIVVSTSESGGASQTTVSAGPTTSDPSTETASATDVGTTTAGTVTASDTDPDPSTTTADTSTTTADTSTTTATTAASESASTSESESESASGEVEDAVYAARFFAGGLDRIRLRKAEQISGRCAEIVLVWPAGDRSPLEITTPDSWGIESAAISEDPACLDFEPLSPPIVQAATGSGMILWPAEPYCPVSLEVEATLGFIAGDLPWVPIKESLSAVEVAVSGC